jgi:hypothetical protein
MSSRSRAVSGRTFSNQPSIAGVLPSSLVSVSSARTRRHTARRSSLWCWSEYHASGRGPSSRRWRRSSHSITPLAPRLTLTPPVVGSCHALGMNTPMRALQARHARWGVLHDLVEVRAADLFLAFADQERCSPAAGGRRRAAHAVPPRNAISGPFWFTAPRPTMTRPRSLSTSRASSGGELTTRPD